MVRNLPVQYTVMYWLQFNSSESDRCYAIFTLLTLSCLVLKGHGPYLHGDICSLLKVRLSEGGSGSLYALCRSWVRNGLPQEGQVCS